MCDGVNKFSDEEMSDYLYEAELFERASLLSAGGILNWFSLETWMDMKEASWESPEYGGGPVGFLDSKRIEVIPTEAIWKSLSNLKDKEFNLEGFKYWQNHLEAYMGTNLIQRVLLESLNLGGEVKDWYEDSLPINYYSFLFPAFPGWEETTVLIKSSNAIKNAESKLASLKDENCPDRLILSHGYLDQDYVSDIYSNTYLDVYLCFNNFFELAYKYSHYSLDYKRVNRYTDKGVSKYWEELFLSSSMKLDGIEVNKTFRSYHHEKDRLIFNKIALMLPPTQSPVKGKWLDGKTWEGYYSWGDMSITEFVQETIQEQTPIETWDNRTWESDSSWKGEFGSWEYLKDQPRLRDEYSLINNYIPGYEPSSEKSIYNVLVGTRKESILIEIFQLDGNDYDIDGNTRVVEGNVSLTDALRVVRDLDPMGEGLTLSEFTE
jgi:hypothetical protein